MKKVMGCLKTVLIVLGVLFVIGLFFGGKSSSESDEGTDIKTEQSTESSTNEAEESKEHEESAKQEKASEEKTSVVDETYISPEFKEAMDSYEAFYDEYVEYLKAYNNDPTNAELLKGMSELLAREAEMTKKFDAWEDEDMTTAETAYYLEVHSRVLAKLAEVQ